MEGTTKVVIAGVSVVAIIAVTAIIIVTKKAGTQIAGRPNYVPPTRSNPTGGTDWGPLINKGADLLIGWWKGRNADNTNNSGYTQVGTLDCYNCDQDNRDAIGNLCDSDPTTCN